jgi:hypothetical protein
MTDRVSHLVVVLEKDAREDDVQELGKAIRQFRGVAQVVLGPAVGAPELIERHRVRQALAMKVFDLIAGGKEEA